MEEGDGERLEGRERGERERAKKQVNKKREIAQSTKWRRHRLVDEEVFGGRIGVADVGRGGAVLDHHLKPGVNGLQLHGSVHPVAKVKLERIGRRFLTEQLVLDTIKARSPAVSHEESALNLQQVLFI